MSGFSGYAWRVDREYIEADMYSEGYDLIGSGDRDLWYRASIVGENHQLVYVFDHDLLVSGMWIFDDVDYQSYLQVNGYLHNAYDLQANRTIQGDDWIESELKPPGTDALIIHRLDVLTDQHVVILLTT